MTKPTERLHNLEVTERADRLVTGHGEPIRVTYDRKPIPSKRFDWSAVRDGYDAGDPIGFGATADEAIADLKNEEAERSEI